MQDYQDDSRSRSSLRLQHKPNDHCNDGHDDRGPYHRRNLLRAPASRRVVGGVVELLVHSGAFQRRSHRCFKIDPAILSEHRQDLVPKRRAFPLAIWLRRCRLCRADRIGCWKTVDQTGFQLGVGFPVGRCGFARVGGMLVVRRRIEFLGHDESPSQVNASAIRTFQTSGAECHQSRHRLIGAHESEVARCPKTGAAGWGFCWGF